MPLSPVEERQIRREIADAMRRDPAAVARFAHDVASVAAPLEEFTQRIDAAARALNRAMQSNEQTG
jgi:hypothetical protein